MTSTVRISAEMLRGVSVLKIIGRVDHQNCQSFQAALMPLLSPCNSAGHAVILDFENLEYISSGGLRVLMIARKAVNTAHGRIAIAAMSETVAIVFGVAHYDSIFSCFKTISAAIDHLKREGQS